MAYSAQSPDDVHFLVRLQANQDELDCSNAFNKQVSIEENKVHVEAVCYEPGASDDQINLFTRDLILPSEIVPEKSSFEWENDSQVRISLKKANGPSYWPVLATAAEVDSQDPQISKIGMWKAMTKKYAALNEDYITDELKEIQRNQHKESN